MSNSKTLNLEDVVLAVYCAIDDALKECGIQAVNGKLLRRRGPAPEVDDREVLCLAVLQELSGFASDNKFHRWLETNPTIRALFPRGLSRPKFAERRALLTPLIMRLTGALYRLEEGGAPPFSSLTPIRSMSVA